MPSVNYRLNPFNDTLNTVTITNETHIISSSSPYTIQLCEAPKKDAPSTMTVRIAGTVAQEVAAYPAQGQFWPDYSTNADGNEGWNTGTILFNSADAGKTVTVTYKATGSIVWADTVNTYVFWESGSIVAPQWAKYAYISGCGGGGGGGGRDAAGSAGGVTSFGSLYSLGGGGGGGRTSGRDSGAAGYNGMTKAGLIRAEPGYYIDYNGEVQRRGGAGGSGPFGPGGTEGGSAGMAGGKRGGGGSGTNPVGANMGGGGGGPGGACIDHGGVPVVGGTRYIVTIGQGGKRGGGSGGNDGGDGAPGLLIVRWGA